MSRSNAGQAAQNEQATTQPSSFDEQLDRLRTDWEQLAGRLNQLERQAHPCSARTVAATAGGESEQITEIARLTAELAEREQRLAEFEATTRHQMAELSEALAAMEGSVSWRATAPLRAVAGRLPQPVQALMLSAAKGLYWIATPHRMASRLRWLSYKPALEHSVKRLASLSDAARDRLGEPLRRAYGESAAERLDIYPTSKPSAPVFIFVHGGAWREGDAHNYAFPAEMFVDAGAHYAILDFIGIREAGGDPRIMAEQVRRGVAWVYRNAGSFGGDPDRLYVGGHSSGAHLAAVALVTDWAGDFGLPPDILKGGLLMSGVYDLRAASGAKRHAYMRLTAEIAAAMSPALRASRLGAPVMATCGSDDTPEFRRQSRGFIAAAVAAGKPAELVEAPDSNHMDMIESLGNPYGPNGRTALRLMGLSPLSQIGG